MLLLREMKQIMLFTALILLTACGGDRQQREKALAADKASLKVAVMPTLDCLPLYVAADRHFFDSAGIDVRLKPFQAQMDCDTALLGGSVEASVTDLVRAERLISKGLPLTYITATDAYWQLVANRLARIHQLQQLGDKMIAVSRYSATSLLATLAVDSAKPKNTVFQVQVNDVGVRLHMLQNNEMDALVFTEPQATVARMAKHPVLTDSRDKDLRLGAFVIRTDALTGDRMRQVNLFKKVYNAACDSINRFGIPHYGDIVRKYCRVDDETVRALPKLRFSHAAQPREKDIQQARKGF